MFDIVILLEKKDLELISYQLTSIKRNIIGYNKIFIITNEDVSFLYSEKNNKYEIIKEDLFPFSLETINKIFGVSNENENENKWYLQKLLKLYMGLIIPNIKERYLVIETNNIFFKEISFIENDKCLYNYSNEYYKPYFEHLEKLDKDLFKRNNYNYSGICNLMMFETRIIKEIINKIETKHNDKFYNVILKSIDPKEYNGLGFSEYELYFNYIMNNHYDEIKIRKLNNKNIKEIYEKNEIMTNYDYISFNDDYLEENPLLKSKIYEKIKENIQDPYITVVYSFIGILPNYIIESIHQCRLYHKNKIYLITNDLNSPYIEKLINKYKVIIIKYNELIKDNEYIKKLEPNFNKFHIDYRIKERYLLFYRSYERIFLIHLLMNQLNLYDVLFMEIDNTIYENPNEWLKGFRKNQIAVMNCFELHCSSGIMYIKNKLSLCNLLEYMLYFINNNIGHFNSEMTAIFKFIYNNDLNDSSNCQLLPITFDTIFNLSINSKIMNDCYKNRDDYEGIFDPLTYGQYLAGQDLVHTNGQLVQYKDIENAYIKCSNYEYDWKEEEGLRKPYIYNKEKGKWILINNLHIHSKHLHLVLSKPL